MPYYHIRASDAAGLWTESVKWNEPLIATAAANEGQRSLLQTEQE